MTIHIPNNLKPSAYKGLVWAYYLTKGLEPVRQKLLQPLKKANAWMAIHDRRTGHYKIRNYPSEVTIQATWRCNLTCPMCFRQMWPEDYLEKVNKFEMPVEDFRKVADEMLPFAYTINLSIGGEPFLVSYMDEVLKIIGRHQCKLEVFTNMTPLVNDKLMDKVFPHIGILRASIDGATKETFEKIREGAKFEPVVKALERFGKLRAQAKDPKPGFGIHITIQKDNINELVDLVRLAHRVGANQVTGDHILVLGPSTKILSVADDTELYPQVYQEANQVGKELGISVDLRPPVTMTKPMKLAAAPGPAPAIECPFLWNRVVVNYNGHTLACCHPEPPEYPGNAIKGFWEIWAGTQGDVLRRDYLTKNAHPSCKGCHLLMNYDRKFGDNKSYFDMENYQEHSKEEILVNK